MQCQINWNIAARYTIGSIKIYIVAYVGKNTCFLYVYSNVRKLNIFTFCLVCCGKQKTWGGLNDLFLITTFTIYLFLYFKILYSRESSPKLSLSAKTHRDSAIWVISGKLFFFISFTFFPSVFHDELSSSVFIRLYSDLQFTFWSGFVSIGCVGNKIWHFARDNL